MNNIIFPGKDYLEIDSPMYSRVKTLAEESPNKRARICIHKNHDSLIQEMLIAVCKGSVIPLHRQNTPLEKSYVVMEGEMDVCFYDDAGDLSKRVKMGSVGSGRVISLRFPADQWTEIEVLNDSVVYYEYIQGPYRPDNTEWKREGK